LLPLLSQGVLLISEGEGAVRVRVMSNERHVMSQ
jgi:hypothetical protein